MNKRDTELLAKQMQVLDHRNDGMVVWAILASMFMFLVMGGLLYTRSTDRFQVASNELTLPGNGVATPSMVQ